LRHWMFYKEEQYAFYAQLTGLSKADAVAAAEALLERVIADAHEVTEGGEFLPLGVWGVRGFNVSAIESLTPPEDRKIDKVLGEVYRVRVLQTRRTQTTTQKRIHRLNVPLQPPQQQQQQQQQPLAIVDTATVAAAAAVAAEAASVAAAAAALAIEDGLPDEQPSSSSSNSSSSSSSSSNRHKKGRHKKSKKDKKARHKKSKKDRKVKKDKKDRKDPDDSRQARTHTDVASLSFM
jgi:hypothetical protein